KFGKDMKAISIATAKLTNDDILQLENNEKIELDLVDKRLELSLEDFEISTSDIPGWTVASNSTLTVELDVTLTDELKFEGMTRELVNRIQNLRKDSGYELTDRIKLKINPNYLLRVEIDNIKY